MFNLLLRQKTASPQSGVTSSESVEDLGGVDGVVFAAAVDNNPVVAEHLPEQDAQDVTRQLVRHAVTRLDDDRQVLAVVVEMPPCHCKQRKDASFKESFCWCCNAAEFFRLDVRSV